MANGKGNEYDQRTEKPAREKPDFAALAKQFPTWDAGELEILWNREDQIQTVSDFKYFLLYCQTNDLNPIIGEAIALYRWNSAKRKEVLTPIVTIGLLRKRRAEECDGLDQFAFQYVGKPPEQVLVSASGTIYRKGCLHPFSGQVYYDEYAARDRQGNLTSMWAGKAHMLLSKVLEAQLTRLAFFDKCGELLVDEETQRGDEEITPKAPAEEFKVGEKVETKPPATETTPPPTETKAPVTETKAAPTETMPAATPAPVLPPTPPPPPPPAATTTVAAPPAFMDLITWVRAKIGGDVKVADKLIARYFGAFLGVPKGAPTPKDRLKLIVPLQKLVEVIDAKVADLKVDPEKLGMDLSGRTPSPLEAEFDTLAWPEPLRDLARQVKALLKQDDTTFLNWIHAVSVGGTAKGTGLALASLPPEALIVFFPLYLLTKEKAFGILDWAIDHQRPITETLTAMVTASGRAIDTWDGPFAEAVIQAVFDASQKMEPAQPPAAPAKDDADGWSGLPFGDL